ncbi:MAG: helix-turn-helix domain-containing protein [Phycisphaerales bacterium]
MAKMFYTLEETAKRLGVSVDEVRTMVSSGRLQEYRDRNNLVFKREQVDILAGDDADPAVIPLASDSGEITLAPEDSKGGSSMPGSTPGSTKERSGISIFEPEEGEDIDPSAQTQVSPAAGGTIGDPGGSGSGLLGLTQEADDTSLGGNLLGGAAPAASPGDTGAGGALFEPAGVASDVSSGGGGVLVMAEPYDGPGSGLVGGLAFAMVLILATLLVAVLFAMSGGGGLVTMLGEGLWMWVGIFAGLAVVGGVVGWLVSK